MDDIVRVDQGGKSPKNLNGKLILEGILLITMSMVLYNLNVASMFAIAPMMLFAAKYGKEKGSIFIGLGLLICFVWELVKFIPQGLGSNVILTELAITMFIPVSLSAAGIIWIYTKGKKLFPRLLLSMAPSLAFVLIFIVVLMIDRALFDSLYGLYQDAFVALLQPVFDMLQVEADLGSFFFLFLITMSSLIMPVTLTAVCANCFIYETVLHSRESDWEVRVMAIEFKPDLVWFFIGSWGLILLCYFISVPIAIQVIAMNIGLTLGVVYAMQGFAVLYTWLRRSMERLKSMTLFIILFIVSTVMPGINIIILLGLPLLGLLESFFDMKKIGEKKHEDYS